MSIVPRRYRAIPEYYDWEYANHDMLAHDVPFFLGQLPKRRQSVLELAVGTGRCAIPLAQAGHRVVGVDYDAGMLAIAQRKRDAVGLGDRELKLMRADMARLRLGERFDWLCVFFNTFLVFTTTREQDRALGMMRRHLKPRGRLWLDIVQPNLRVLIRPVARDLEPMSFHVPELDRTVFKTTEVRPDTARQVQRITFHYQWFDGNGREQREGTEFDLAIIWPRELRLLLERNGFRVQHLYGNYDGSELNVDSPRMIACCSRLG